MPSTSRPLRPSSKFKVIGSRNVIDKPTFVFREDEIELHNGRRMKFYVTHSRDWAGMVGFTPKKEIVLIQQHRHAVQRMQWELPAGIMNTNETPQAAAVREFREETGYEITNVKSLGEFYPSSGRSSTKMHLFCGEVQGKVGEQQLDECEEIDVHVIPIKKVLEMIKTNEIDCGHSAFSILLAKEKFPKYFE